MINNGGIGKNCQGYSRFVVSTTSEKGYPSKSSDEPFVVHSGSHCGRLGPSHQDNQDTTCRFCGISDSQVLFDRTSSYVRDMHNVRE